VDGVNIIVVEDQLMFREVIKKACSARAGHHVIGETDSGVKAVELSLRLKPDAVILDLSLPDMDGFNVVDQVTKELPNLKILVVSSHCDDYTLFRVEKSRVHGFIDKNSNTVQTLRLALAAIQSGEIYFSQTFRAAKAARHANPHSYMKLLSDHERAVLSLIGQGLDDEEIGQRVNISYRTAQTHRSRILRKLMIKGTPKLIAFAIENGFTRVQSTRAVRPVFS
jgi:DNA-binding NarL/FixJ family response regulator